MTQAQEREKAVVGRTLVIIAALLLVVLTAGNIFAVVQANKLTDCMSRSIDTSDKRQGFTRGFDDLNRLESQVFVDAFDGKVTADQAKAAIRKIQTDRVALAAKREQHQAPELADCR